MIIAFKKSTKHCVTLLGVAPDMIDEDKKSRLGELLAAHGEVKSISQIPTDQHSGTCMLLATMKSPEEASKLHRQFGFQTFGYDSLIIGEEWVMLHFTD